MGRILKQLTSGLKEVNGNCNIFLHRSRLIPHQESNNLKMGTLSELSPNASGMLRVSILTAWARLEIASAEQPYLLDVIKPYREILALQWVACLRDYATIRADSEFVHDSSLLSLDPSFANLGKVVLLPVSDFTLSSRFDFYDSPSITPMHGPPYCKLLLMLWPRLKGLCAPLSLDRTQARCPMSMVSNHLLNLHRFSMSFSVSYSRL